MSAYLGRLRRRREYLRVAGAKRRWATPGLVLQAARTPKLDDAVQPPEAAEATVRVGITVSRKVGNAVARNRARRRLRALAAETLPRHAKAGHDYVLIGRKGTLARPYDRLRDDLATALAKLGLRQQPPAAAGGEEPAP